MEPRSKTNKQWKTKRTKLQEGKTLSDRNHAKNKLWLNEMLGMHKKLMLTIGIGRVTLAKKLG